MPRANTRCWQSIDVIFLSVRSSCLPPVANRVTPRSFQEFPLCRTRRLVCLQSLSVRETSAGRLLARQAEPRDCKRELRYEPIRKRATLATRHRRAARKVVLGRSRRPGTARRAAPRHTRRASHFLSGDEPMGRYVLPTSFVMARRWMGEARRNGTYVPRTGVKPGRRAQTSGADSVG